MKKTIAVLAFFVAAVLAGFFMNYTYAAAGPAVKESFMQEDKAMPLNMEPVQGYEGTSPILGSEPRPISTKPFDMTDDDHIATLADTKQSADCGPSPFSGDLGYVCMTNEQKATFASRGGNRAA
jgi:hypothetical protein